MSSCPHCPTFVISDLLLVLSCMDSSYEAQNQYPRLFLRPYQALKLRQVSSHIVPSVSGMRLFKCRSGLHRGLVLCAADAMMLVREKFVVVEIFEGREVILRAVRWRM